MNSTSFGAYWRSYDFATNAGKQNIFTHPLTFTPSGGEIIFNLPNGLQGYLLVDGRGSRIDDAPIAIVSILQGVERARIDVRALDRQLQHVGRPGRLDLHVVAG